jgi:NADH-quinone oxidoreductase subunit M
MGILSLLILIPIVGAIVLALMPPDNKLARMVAFGFAGAAFAVSLGVLAQFKTNTFHFQLQEKYAWVGDLGIQFHLGVDGLSIWLIVLTSFLTLIALAYGHYVNDRTKSFLALILVLEAAMLGSFLALDLIAFFTFFEATLIPMWLLVNNWGGEKRNAAANKFLIYTFAGSIFMLIGMVVIAAQMRRVTGVASFDIVDIQNQVAQGGLWVAGAPLETIVFWTFAVAFLVKAPSFPFHTWIADTYSESPIVAPILSSTMVKLGSFGFLRFVLPLFPDAVQTQAPLLMGLAVASILYGAIVAAVQTDLRRMLAYSSLSHMGFILLGIFSLSFTGIMGGSYQQISHGITTSALFLLVGFLFIRCGETKFTAFGGLKSQMPVFSALFLISMLASAGLPGTNGFVGEFLSLLGGFESGYAGRFGLSTAYVAAAAIGVILAAAYLLYMFQQVFYGPIENPLIRRLRDLKTWEVSVVSVLVVLILWGGLYPSTFTKPMEASAQAARLMAIDPAGTRPAWRDISLEIDTEGSQTDNGALVRVTPDRKFGESVKALSVVAPSQIRFTGTASSSSNLVGMNR